LTLFLKQAACFDNIRGWKKISESIRGMIAALPAKPVLMMPGRGTITPYFRILKILTDYDWAITGL
jgi:hypothetical protein